MRPRQFPSECRSVPGDKAACGSKPIWSLRKLTCFEAPMSDLALRADLGARDAQCLGDLRSVKTGAIIPAQLREIYSCRRVAEVDRDH